MAQIPMGKPGQFSEYPYDDFRIPSSTQKGLNITASIFEPTVDPKAPAAPVIVLAHGIGAIRFAGLQHFAERFAKAGYFAVTFDYLYWGDSDGLPRNHMSVSQQKTDYKDVIQWIRTHSKSATDTAAEPSFAWDPKKVIIWGTSFSGMHVTALLAEDQTLAAGIAQCPCVDGYKAAMMMPKSHLVRFGQYIVRDQLSAITKTDRCYVGLTDTGADGRMALMPGAEAVKGKENIVRTAQGMSLPQLEKLASDLDKITARSVINVMLSRPVLKAKKITAPFLVVLPEYDNQAPISAAKKAAEVSAKGELVTAKGGHFDIYYGCVGWDINIDAQLKFLEKHFPRSISVGS